MKGHSYWTTPARLQAVNRNGGWLLVDDQRGQKGYVPLIILKPPSPKPATRPVQPGTQETPNGVQPITDMNDDPIILPHTLVDCGKLEDDI